MVHNQENAHDYTKYLLSRQLSSEHSVQSLDICRNLGRSKVNIFILKSEYLYYFV